MMSKRSVENAVAAAEGDPAELATAAGAAIAQQTGVAEHDVAIVMGSGWRPAADSFPDVRTEISVTDLPGFAPTAVAGHVGVVKSVKVAGSDGEVNALLFLGRTHYYEQRGVAAVVHGVRTAIAAGCKTIILTNAAGGLQPSYEVGQPVLISDHLNLTATSPLVGARFVDLTDLYSPRLRALAQQIDSSLVEGVYAALPGPHYETPAEIKMLATLGADLVGMSTALEAIAARADGAEVLGISLVTNLAAGITGEPLNHAEVLEAGRASAARMGDLLAHLVARVG